MMKRVSMSAVYAVSIVIILYLTLFAMVPKEVHITLLNSAFLASGIVVFVSYIPLIRDIFLRDRPYDRITHYLLGILCIWTALYMLTFNSIFIRATIDIALIPNQSFFATAGRFIAIVGAIFQVTAPDFGEGVLYGRDRKFLWIGLTLGIVAGVISVYVQRSAL